MREDVYIKIAYWYYTLGMTQDEIAKRLSFTRQKVNQIINSLMDCKYQYPRLRKR